MKKKEEVVAAIGFHCPDCEGQCDVHYAYIENGVLMLQGICPTCNTGLRFNCDVIEASLRDKNYIEGNMRVN